VEVGSVGYISGDTSLLMYPIHLNASVAQKARRRRLDMGRASRGSGWRVPAGKQGYFGREDGEIKSPNEVIRGVPKNRFRPASVRRRLSLSPPSYTAFNILYIVSKPCPKQSVTARSSRLEASGIHEAVGAVSGAYIRLAGV
jgi:hypothetical protein